MYGGTMLKKRLVELRKFLKLSQEEFSKKLGVGRSSVSCMETGKNPITEPTIKLICFIFCVNEEWLRDGKGEMFQGNETPLEQEFIELFRNLSPQVQAMVRDYVRMILEQQQTLQSIAVSPLGKNENVVANNAGESDDAGEEQEIA
jgi:transcriptional regulator with XRE-family HTH domain